MKFTQRIFLYKVNEDNTVTFYTKETPDSKPNYFRANARLKLLVEISEMKQHTEIDAEIGVYYDRQLKLQIIQLIY